MRKLNMTLPLHLMPFLTPTYMQIVLDIYSHMGNRLIAHQHLSWNKTSNIKTWNICSKYTKSKSVNMAN